MNVILNIIIIISILISNSLLLIIGCYGKVGYYPLFLILTMLFYNTSYQSILFDLINKRAYFSSFTIIINYSIFFRCTEYYIIPINLLIIISFIRLISSIKHIILFSPYLLFISIYLLLLINNYLFSYLFSITYIIINIIILLKIRLFDIYF